MSIASRRMMRRQGQPITQPSGPLQLSSISQSLTSASATISWQTNKPADSHAAMYFGPAKHCTWNWQLSGTLDTSAPAQVYDFDGFEGTAAEVSQLHAQGIYCIAYFGGGDWEDYRADASAFPASVLGNPIDGWPSEKWIDVRQLAILRPIMAARADIAKNKGFDAIEWDCVDNYEQSSGFPLTRAHQFAFNTMLAQLCHERGMACFLKNCVSDLASYQPYFEGNLVEQAYEYNEQAAYSVFANAGKPVLVCEYRDQDVTVANQNDANARGFSLIRHNLNLNSRYVASFVTNPAAPVTLTNTASPRVNTTLATSHSMTFTGLTPGQRYGYLVWSQVGSEKVYDTTPRSFVAV